MSKEHFGGDVTPDFFGVTRNNCPVILLKGILFSCATPLQQVTDWLVHEKMSSTSGSWFPLLGAGERFNNMLNHEIIKLL